MTTHYLACDLGAESGRLMLGELSNGRLALEEIHRFVNEPLRDGNSLHWNIPALFEGVAEGLRKAAARRIQIASISCDSWGLDYFLLDGGGRIMPPTFHYRDPRTARGIEAIRAKMPWEKVFDETGIQFMPINTLFQLAAESPERLESARLVLPLGDGFNHFLSGEARAEVSLASTTQLYNPRTRTWSKPLLDALNLPAEKLPPIIPSGTRLGTLRRAVIDDSRLNKAEVLATCSHDTGAAVAAVPAVSSSSWAYLSSGTWSLIGVERAEPVINDLCRELNFTNEIGHGGSVRLLKNIIGLWLVQECRREWAAQGRDFDYATLTRMAADSPPFVSLVNAADSRFIQPGDMPGKIAAFCRETEQPEPASPGAFIRCALESLALLYRHRLEQLERLNGRRIEVMHIVGGGSKNALLNQFTANALQIPVVAGPAEATAAGNILVQAITLGHLATLEEARHVIRNSTALVTIEPEERDAWMEAYARLRHMMGEGR